MSNFYLYGASGHAKVIMDILSANGLKIAGFIDDNIQLNNFMGYPVFHEAKGKESMIISIGNNLIRKKIALKLVNTNFIKAIHPSSSISTNSSIANGTVIMHGAIIQSCTVIGNHCIVNTSATIDHDCIINDFVHISPNATLCGNVHVGEGSQVSAGAVVIPGVKIGKWSFIAAGAIVVRDVPDNTMVMGNPATIKKTI